MWRPSSSLAFAFILAACGGTAVIDGPNGDGGGTSSGTTTGTGTGTGTATGTGTGTGTGSGTGTGTGIPGNPLVGEWLLAIDSVMTPGDPAFLFASTTVSDDMISLQLTPLDVNDPTIAVGETTSYGPFPVSGSDFAFVIPELFLPAEATPVDFEVTLADLVLTNQAAEPPYCGDLAGFIVQPLTANLAGSTFGMAKIVGPNLPAPVLSCN